MAAHDPATRSAAARLNAAKRWHPDRDPSDLRRDLRAAQIEAAIRKAVDAAPPLTPEQRTRIALLLRGSGGAAA